MEQPKIWVNILKSFLTFLPMVERKFFAHPSVLLEFHFFDIKFRTHLGAGSKVQHEIVDFEEVGL